MNISLPLVTGTLIPGGTASASTGSWSSSTPMSCAYQWSKCDSTGASCLTLAGATSADYALSTADTGATLRVIVTASNAYGSSSGISLPTASVSAASDPAPTSPTSSVTFAASLNKKQSSRKFDLAMGGGQMDVRLSFSRLPALTLTVADANGTTIAAASGPSAIKLVKSLAAGIYVFTVTSAGGNDSFTLTVVYPTP